jgi:hypothetical protein
MQLEKPSGESIARNQAIRKMLTQLVITVTTKFVYEGRPLKPSWRLAGAAATGTASGFMATMSLGPGG